MAHEQIVSHLERELEINGLEAPDEIQLKTVMQQDTQQNSEKPKPTCHHCKKPGHYRNQCRQLKREKDQVHNITDSAANNKNNNGSAQTNSNPNHKAPAETRRTIQIFKETEDLDLSFHPVRRVAEQTTPQRDATLEQTQRADRLPGIDGRKDKTKPNREILKITRMGMSKL